jgi:ribosomal protein S18 acetylase RimI-like enzyme
VHADAPVLAAAVAAAQFSAEAAVVAAVAAAAATAAAAAGSSDSSCGLSATRQRHRREGRHWLLATAMGATERLASIASGVGCRLAPVSATEAANASSGPAGRDPHDAAAPTDPDHVTVVSVFGSVLDRETAGRCQEILQRSFHGDPERKGFYIPLPEHLLLTGAEKEQAVDALLGQATRRREMWHLAFDAVDGALAALATTFEHTVLLADGSRRDILALGEVATHPEYRGRGHGAAAVRTAFGEVSDSPGARDVMLWQTGEAQGLYEKLGARVCSPHHPPPPTPPRSRERED